MATTPTRMKAWSYETAKGGLENGVRLIDVDIPMQWSGESKTHEIVEVKSRALNPGEVKMAEGYALLGKILSWLLIAKPAIPGLDYAGTIQNGPRHGTRVFGRFEMPSQYGSFGEYTLAPKNGMVELPETVSFDDGAAIGTGAISAYQTIVPHVKRNGGARVFINGGSGGVGTFTIQIAKILGCHVVASCSSRNIELCTSLGADEVIDYTKVENGDVAHELARRVHAGTLQKFDLVIENVGRDHRLHSKAAAFTKDDGQFILLAATDEGMAGLISMMESWLRPTWLGGPKIKWKFVMAYNDLAALKELIDWRVQGRLRCVVDEVYSFEEAPAAIRRMKTGRAQGRIIITNALKG